MDAQGEVTKRCQTTELIAERFLQAAGSLAAAGGLTNISTLSAPSKPYQTVSPRFQWLRLGQVVPAGWIKAQLQMDLGEGFAGKLDQFAPAEAAKAQNFKVSNQKNWHAEN